MTTTALHRDFEGFYRAHFRNTVTLVYAFTASTTEAQDIAQEAFARAWQRWRVVSVYDNPAAWVRHVACNLAHARWRRMRNAAAYLVGQRLEHEPEISADHVAVVAALRTLPRRVREAVVLHHLLDVPVVEIAGQLDVPEGTVKSWLHRGRTALAGKLAIDMGKAIEMPPASEVVKQATRIRRVRTASAATAIVLLLVGALVAAWIFRPHREPLPIQPTPIPSPSPTSNVDPDDPILKVDWLNATISGDGLKASCVRPQPMVFHESRAKAVIGTPNNGPYVEFRPGGILYGDLTGDGKAEAVIHVSCGVSLVMPADVSWIVRRDADASLHVFATAEFGGYAWIEDGTLYGDPFHASQEYRLGRISAARWNGNALVPVETVDRYPPIKNLDLSAVAARVPCGGLAPRAQVKLDFDPGLTAVDGDRRWVLDFNQWGSFWIDLGRPGLRYLMTDVSCHPLAVQGYGQDSRPILLDLTPQGWRALAVVDTGPVTEWAIVKVQGHTLTLQQNEGSGIHNVDYLWNGTGFVRQT